MRKVVVGVVVGAVALVALVVAAFVLAPNTTAQGNRRIQRADPLLLEGPGSSIGVSVSDLNSEEVAKLRAGVRIDSVAEETAAARAGLRSGDVVVEFDGEAVRSVRQFTRLVRETPPGRLVKTTIVRDGSRRTLDVTPEVRGRTALERVPILTDRAFRAFPRDFAFDFDFNPPEGFGLRVSPRRLGATLTPLTDQLAAYFGVKEGALVSSVEPDSPAAQAGLMAGDVITSVSGRTVETPSDVSQAIGDAQPGSSVEVRVMRDRKEMTLKATLPERRRLSFGPDRLPV